MAEGFEVLGDIRVTGWPPVVEGAPPGDNALSSALAALEAIGTPCGWQAGAACARRLIGGYPWLDAPDPKGYAETLACILGEAPHYVAILLSDPLSNPLERAPTATVLREAVREWDAERAMLVWRGQTVRDRRARKGIAS